MLLAGKSTIPLTGQIFALIKVRDNLLPNHMHKMKSKTLSAVKINDNETNDHTRLDVRPTRSDIETKLSALTRLRISNTFGVHLPGLHRKH